MKVIIAGSRTITDFAAVSTAVEAAAAQWDAEITEVVSGAALGVDYLGERWAKAHDIPVHHFPALWEVHGRSAGPIRNVEMAAHADALVLVWDGQSPGSRHMRNVMQLRGKPIHEVVVEPPA